MKLLASMGLLCAVTASPVWAGETEAFDPDQPFKQAMSQQLLESLLSQALEAFSEHLEISGSLDPELGDGDRKQGLRFKFYPEGKSKSEDHIVAEGWLGPSEDSHQRELHFRFAVPNSSAGSSRHGFDNVL
ncbi:hypothetical protein [Petrachloros mirabilis]